MIVTKTKYTTIKNFTIYGERCSGTKYLEKTIYNSFNIPITWEFGHKHFFGHTSINSLREAKNTLFIGIIRNPFNWIQSFYKEGYHIHPNKMKSMNLFVMSDWYSVYDNYEENPLDRNYLTKERYSNIVDMRNHKNEYLINTMPIIVNNYCLLNYDLMLKDQDLYLQKIQHIFGLKRTSYKPQVKIKPYYYTHNNHYNFICSNLNWKNENMIGFYKELYPENYILNK